MKRTITTVALLSLSLLFSAGVFAQEEEQQPARAPRWISEKGYWVVESNIHTPYHSIIHFYNNENVQVYKEVVDGVKINLDKNRTKMRLKKVLEQSIVAWEKTHRPKQDEQWVYNALRTP